jgi:hypothetical protein
MQKFSIQSLATLSFTALFAAGCSGKHSENSESVVYASECFSDIKRTSTAEDIVIEALMSSSGAAEDMLKEGTGGAQIFLENPNAEMSQLGMQIFADQACQTPFIKVAFRMNLAHEKGLESEIKKIDLKALYLETSSEEMAAEMRNSLKGVDVKAMSLAMKGNFKKGSDEEQGINYVMQFMQGMKEMKKDKPVVMDMSGFSPEKRAQLAPFPHLIILPVSNDQILVSPAQLTGTGSGRKTETTKEPIKLNRVK